MALIRKKTSNVLTPVSVSTPQDGGGFTEETLQVRLSIIKRSRLREIIEQTQTGDLSDDDIARELVVGWEDYLDETGEPVIFSYEALEELLENPFVPSAIAYAVVNMYSGDGAKAKN